MGHRRKSNAIYEREPLPQTLWTTGEVSVLLKASPFSVRKWARDGELPFARLGHSSQSHMRFVGTDVLEFALTTRRIIAGDAAREVLKRLHIWEVEPWLLKEYAGGTE